MLMRTGIEDKVDRQLGMRRSRVRTAVPTKYFLQREGRRDVVKDPS